MSGAVVLAFLVRTRDGTFKALRGRGLIGALALFGYAGPFSFAYLRIGAAVGALVLFGVVQMTMIGYAVWLGERPSALAWVGILLAAGGLAGLTVPAAVRPDVPGVLLMSVAGIFWAAYSLTGRSAADALTANARSFLWSSPAAVLAVVISPQPMSTDRLGILLAAICGAVTSGLGYVVWYRAVRDISVTKASVAQ